MKNFNRFQILMALVVLVVSLVFLTGPAYARDKNVLISPTRVVFEGKTRASVVKLINPNNKTKSFKISILSMRMDEYGRKFPAEPPTEEELFVQKMIRYAPRRVTIGPNVWQTVRLMVRKPKDLPAGEYRAQLKVSPILNIKQSPDENEHNNTGVDIKIKYAFSISIPVIVRHGQGEVNLVPHTPKLITKNEKTFLETDIERTGSLSSYFDVFAFLIPAGQSQRIELGSSRGRSIYAENSNQIVQIPVNQTITNGQVEIKILDREKSNKPVMHSERFNFNGINRFEN